ncbi:MAG: Crp/Fnr family transcriptional regulator [Pseudomonadota bacterium]
MSRCCDTTAVDCGSCGLIPKAAWDGMPGELLTKLAERKTIRRLARGEHLFHQGGRCDALFRVLSGVVMLQKGDREGNALIVQMVRKGATIGYRAFVRDEPHEVSAFCATDVVVCHIPAHLARWAFQQNRELERGFATHLARELDQTENQILNILALTVRDRVLVLLDQMAEEFGTPVGDGLRIETPILRTDMAAMLGIARETMSRCIRLIESEGLLRFDRVSVHAPSAARFHEAIAAIRGTQTAATPDTGMAAG